MRCALDTGSMPPGCIMCCSICNSRWSWGNDHDDACIPHHGSYSQPSLGPAGAAWPSAPEYTSQPVHMHRAPVCPCYRDAQAVSALHCRDEVLLMQQLRHPHVLQFLGACMRPPRLAMVTEHMPQSLHHVLYNTTTVVDTKR